MSEKISKLLQDMQVLVIKFKKVTQREPEDKQIVLIRINNDVIKMMQAYRFRDKWYTVTATEINDYRVLGYFPFLIDDRDL